MDTQTHSSDESEYHSEERLPINREIDAFISEHLDDILDMFYEFQERFSWCPFFLANLKSTHLTDFLIDVVFNNRHRQPLNRTQLVLYERFIVEYEVELHISLTMVNTFLNRFKCTVPPLSWALFCFSFSDLSEVSRLGCSWSRDHVETIDSHQEDIS